MYRIKPGFGAQALALLVAVQPVVLLSWSTPANAASIACGSVRGGYQYCQADTGRGVQLMTQLSRAPCLQGQTWGYDRAGVWVNNGCAANFAVGYGGGVSKGVSRDGSNAGAAVVGGIVGALLGAALAGGDNRSTQNTYVTRTYTHDNSSWQGWQSQDRQRSDYLANQNNQLQIQAAQDRQDRDNARASAAEASAAADRARGEADELAQAKDAEVAAARADADRQAEIKQGEDDENRQARDAEAAAASSNDPGAAAEETPQ